MKMMMRWMKLHQKMKLVTIGPSTLLYLILLLVLRFSPIIITHRGKPKPNEETIELQKGRYDKIFNEEDVVWRYEALVTESETVIKIMIYYCLFFPSHQILFYFMCSKLTIKTPKQHQLVLLSLLLTLKQLRTII